MAGKKKSTPIPLQSLDTLFGTTSEEQAGIQQIALDNLHSFFMTVVMPSVVHVSGCAIKH